MVMSSLSNLGGVCYFLYSSSNKNWFLIYNKNIKKKVLFQHDVVSRFTRNEQFSQQQTFKTNETLVLSHDYAFIFIILCVILSYLVKGKVLDPDWSFKKDKQKF